MRLILAGTMVVWPLILAGLGMGAAGQSAKHGRNTVNGDEAVQETDDLIGAWLNMIDRAGGAWVTVTDLKLLPDARRVQRDSEEWCALFFTAGANPHQADAMPVIAIHRATPETADIIRYDYASGNMRLRLYETVDFVLLRVEQTEVEPLNLHQDKIPAAITRISRILLNKPAPAAPSPVSEEAQTWAFQFSPPIQEGSRFSTGASQDPHLMPSWTSRVDGGIRGGRLYFMCFKKRQSGDGRLIILNSHHWFDGQAWAPYEGPKPR